jgi:ubiquitin fusion degradation protein 1
MFKMLKFREPGSPGTVCLVADLKKSKEHSYVKLQPHLTKFIELPNPKAILEIQLRNFTCLHVGDTITIKTFDGDYEIDILEIKPKNDYDAICVIDADVEVDFAPPHDYEEPTMNKKQSHITYEGQPANNAKQDVFGGKGVRIDEKSQASYTYC